MSLLTKIIALFAFLFYSARVYSQTFVEGKITNKSHEFVSNVSVCAKKKSANTIISFCISDARGYYKLICKDLEPDSLYITVSGMNIKPKTKLIKNTSQKLDFEIVEKVIELKEVVVKSRKIWAERDTINYLVSAFSDKKDFVIGDVLKKMPGIQVGDDGSISFHGRLIGDLYIENLNLLQGKYGIATNNIPAKDVETIQVLQNHQAIKSLEDMEKTSNASINLQLKEEAKGKLGMTAHLGAGMDQTSFLWNNELSLMRFGKNEQNISTYKGNNSGAELQSELRSFDSSSNVVGGKMLNIQTLVPPSINDSRYLFNHSNSVTFNQLLKTSADAEATVNLGYYNDFETRKGNNTSMFYLPSTNSLIIDENICSSTKTNMLNAKMRYSLNKKSKYINNELKVSGVWDTRKSDVISPQSVHQKLEQPSFSISDDFTWIIKTAEKKGFSVNASTGFVTAPQRLFVLPGLYPELFNGNKAYSMLQQNVHANNYYLNTNCRLLSPLRWKNFSFNPEASLQLNYKLLKSDLYTKGRDEVVQLIESDSMRNHMNQFRTSLKTALLIKYDSPYLDINLGLPVAFNFVHFTSHYNATLPRFHKPYFIPSLQIEYKHNANLAIKAGYSFSNNFSDLSSLYQGYILTGYRNLSRYSNKIAESHSNGGGISIEYKDVSQMLFMSINTSYDYSCNNLTYGQNFHNIVSVLTSLDKDNSSKNYSLSLIFNKGLNWKKMLIQASVTGNSTLYTQFQQGQLLDSRDKSIQALFSVTCTPFSSMQLSCRSIWWKNWNKLMMNGDITSFSSIKNIGSLSYSILKDLIFTFDYEHYYNSASLSNKNLSFMDSRLTFIHKNIHYILECNNLLNVQNYVSAYYSPVNSFYNVYHIRPLSVMLKLKLKLF